jgi:predicted ester cyclase
MVTITEVAERFFKACKTGEGWEGYAGFCTPNATCAAQAEPLAGITNLSEYAEWMKGLLTFMPNGRYEVRSFAIDEQRRNVCAYGVFSATHTVQGGPMPPTGKSTTTDYLYFMQFDGDRICHMTKIWNAPWAMKALGWA